MILKALADYYERMRNDPKRNIAPPGYQAKAIPNIIVIDLHGFFVQLTVDNQATRKYLVPRERIRSGKKAYKKPNYLWDFSGYVTGQSKEKSKNSLLQHEAFKNLVSKMASAEGVPEEIKAIDIFYSSGELKKLFSSENWEDAQNSNRSFSFRIKGNTNLVCQHPWVHAFIEKEREAEGAVRQICLVSGKSDFPVKTLAKIKNVWGKPQRDRSLVAFNQDSFCSFGKQQSYNSPIGESAEFAFSTALNTLLASHMQRMQVGDASTVFWAKKEHPFEQDFSCFLGEPVKGESPNYGKIRSLLNAVRTGVLPEEDDIPFYVLGLAPNASRIAIRFWYEGNVRDLKEKIAQHFEDIEIVRAPHDREFLSLFQLLVSVAPEGKADKIPPNLGGDLARSVLAGIPYPRTLLSSAVRRCKAEQRITHARAALIKGFLVRESRFKNSKEKEVHMALDKTNENIGYILGRLFSVLERIQEQAQSGLNKTIRDTYFSAASSSPQVTFKRLQDLAIHHLAKIRNSGQSTVWLEMLLQEVMGKIPAAGLPATLSVDDQGRFAIGYYHQRQDFFTKKEKETKGDES